MQYVDEKIKGNILLGRTIICLNFSSLGIEECLE